MRVQDMRKKDASAPDVEDNLLHEEFEKRAPMGFQGMRGKKDYLLPDFEDAYLRDEYEKRAPMGFQGMRGKKTLLEDEYYKRAPMGFQGMRGKKSLEQVSPTRGVRVVLNEILRNGWESVRKSVRKIPFAVPKGSECEILIHRVKPCEVARNERLRFTLHLLGGGRKGVKVDYS